MYEIESGVELSEFTKCCHCNNEALHGMKRCQKCREDNNLRSKKNYKENKEKAKTYSKTIYKLNKKRILNKQKEFKKENPDKVYAHKLKYKTAKLNAFVANVDKFEIFKRDGYICQLCGKPTNPDVHYYNSEYPSIDHIIPLSKGGTHEPDNVQCSHNGCNKSKGNRSSIGVEYEIF